MLPDEWSLYEMMLKSRLYEESIAKLWHDGLISGEMHLGTGEEAIIAGVVSQLHDNDAMALDHRGTAPLIMRGLDPALILRECLGRADGLCRGMGGHMHLFSKEHLAASSGIVGAAGPTAAGFALALQLLHPGAIAVAFFGEGSMNQGMLLESLNLASVWKLPVLFVCKDDTWSITTKSESMTGGDLIERVRGFGIPTLEVDGSDVLAVWEAAHSSLEYVRSGQGPMFLYAQCVHLEGHFLGFQLLRIIRHPIREMPEIALPLTRSFLGPGGSSARERLAGLKDVLSSMLSTLRDPRRESAKDPLQKTRKSLLADKIRLHGLEDQTEHEVNRITASVLEEVDS